MAKNAYRFFNKNKNKIFFFCLFVLFVSLIIGLSVKYGFNKSLESDNSASTYTQSPISVVDVSESPTTQPATTQPATTQSATTQPTYVPSESPTTLSPTISPSPNPHSTESPVTTGPNIGLEPSHVPTSPPTSPVTNPVTNPPTPPIPKPRPRPTAVPTRPVLNGKEGDYCLYNDTCLSRVCANTHQSNGTIYHNTCLPNNLPKGSVCYKDQSCKSYSCMYNWSFDKYTCS